VLPYYPSRSLSSASDNAPAALKALEEKFRTIKNGKGIAYTVPMTGTIGVAIYRFLANIHS
jgi:hypothetical protein